MRYLPGPPISFAQLEALCDDPARDQLPGMGEVRALLDFEPATGFSLSAADGERVHEVFDDGGRRVRWRTIEAALAALQRVSGLSADVGIRLAGAGGKDPQDG